MRMGYHPAQSPTLSCPDLRPCRFPRTKRDRRHPRGTVARQRPRTAYQRLCGKGAFGHLPKQNRQKSFPTVELFKKAAAKSPQAAQVYLDRLQQIPGNARQGK